MEKGLSIAALVVALLALTISVWPTASTVGGDIYNKVIDVQGLTINGTSFVSSARAVSAGAVTASTISATGLTSVVSTVSSTLVVGGTKTGCIEIGSATGNGKMYMTAVTTTGAGTVTVTSTKPAICQ